MRILSYIRSTHKQVHAQQTTGSLKKHSAVNVVTHISWYDKNRIRPIISIRSHQRKDHANYVIHRNYPQYAAFDLVVLVIVRKVLRLQLDIDQRKVYIHKQNRK